jgi:hypothetical protein
MGRPLAVHWPGGESSAGMDHGGRIVAFSTMDTTSSKTNGPEKLL